MNRQDHRNPFLARTPEERVIEAVERLKFDVQYALQAAMKDRGITQAELAERLGVTPARVSQMFAWGANPRLETVAKAFAVLDEDIFFESETVPFAPRMGNEKDKRRQRRESSVCDAPETPANYGYSRSSGSYPTSGRTRPQAPRNDDMRELREWRTLSIGTQVIKTSYISASNDAEAVAVEGTEKKLVA